MSKSSLNDIKKIALEYGDSCVEHAGDIDNDVYQQKSILKLYELMGAIKLYGAE